MSTTWAAGQGNLNSSDGNTEPLEDPLGPKCCRTFVLALHADVASGIPIRLRTYFSDRDHPTPHCTIWQAGRATSAAPTFFDPIIFGIPPIKYVDAGLGYNNPSREALSEAIRIWPERTISCLLNIGTGNQSQARLGDSPLSLTMLKGLHSIFQVAQACVRISTDCDRIANDVRAECRRQRITFIRLNVREGLDNIGLEEYTRVKEIGGYTQEYLCQNETDEWTGKCASLLGDEVRPLAKLDATALYGMRRRPLFKTS